MKVEDGERSTTFLAPRPTLARKIRRALLRWYQDEGRHFRWRNRSAGLYQKIVAEVLLQRTQAGTVAAFYDDFLKRFPNWQSLAESSAAEIGNHIKPLGLWKRRGESLAALASVMSSRRGRFPRTRREIEQLPGVGQYIASAVLLFSQTEPEPLLDVNMARVLERLFGARTIVDIRYDPHLQFTSRVVLHGREPERINWAILDLAALICVSRNPRCSVCPLLRFCPTGAENGSRDGDQ